MITVTTGGSHPDDLRRIIDTIPEWFGLPAENDAYVAKASTLANVVARDHAGEIVGICLLLHHNRQSVEIDFLGVPRDRHRQGIGRTILDHVEAELRATGVRLLHLKTFGPSVPNEPYERTRAFYESNGFTLLEERTDIWSESNPCAFYVKPLA